MPEPTDTPPEPLVEPSEAPPPVSAAHPCWLPWLTSAGLLILAAALVWVWRHPIVAEPQAERVDTLARQLSAFESRVSRLEQRPSPQAADLGPLTARVTALEKHPAPQAPGAAISAPDLVPLEARVDALEQQRANLAPLEARIASLEHRQAASLAPLEGRIAALEGSESTMLADLSRRVTANNQASRHTALIQAAALALASGQKLGDLQGAPPALARFANAAPPTEAALRLAFPAAARAALAAAHPPTAGEPLLARMWAEAQDLVTIRQGDRMLVGDPTAGVLERSRAALDAGDLPIAVKEVATLQGAAAEAMAAWLDQARTLLEARAALTAWAASG